MKEIQVYRWPVITVGYHRLLKYPNLQTGAGIL